MQTAERLARRTPFFYGWVVLFSAGSSMFVRNAAASLTLAVFVYPLSQELGWSRTLIAGAASAGGLVASATSPGIGWLIDRYGAKIVLATSVFVLGLATISLAWAVAPLTFYLAYGAGRMIFSSPLQIGASVVVSRWFIRMRGRAVGLLSLTHSAGMVLFPLIASVTIAYRDYQSAWIVLGVMAWVIALPPVILFIAETPEDVGLAPDGDSAPVDSDAADSGQPSAQDPVWTAGQAMRTKTLWLLAVGVGLLFVIHSGTNIHLVAYFRDQGLGETIAASAISVMAVSMAASSVPWGWIVERLPIRMSFMLTAAAMAAASVLFISADSTEEAYAYSAVFGFALAGLLTVPPVAYANYFGRLSLGTIRGVTEPFMSLGQAIGAVVSGAIYDVTDSYTIAFLTFATLGVATMAGIAFASKPSPPSAPADLGEN
ncbi:MAG: MFS transporter [SAR202 cluster bacterium]|jgi:MFS family permease|nr:MFS transporter [SAR202 cluster bacterium]MDP6665542.1 MFS transporter [SAR202 cluster bacterium]MDP6799495.1 MFS transporter [SAR202 cluster bacterium]MQG70558.1 MFS transporter [SAR202 cluster bacterium]|tara:strand:- start:1578 stop:2867 length:1290 start_codon:yes stop_codon:yes gene_type:complete